MKDIAREKYARLMDEIEQIEDLISEVEGQEKPEADELARLRDELAIKRNELARLSDGCGKPHP
jgi:uncharacterized protein YdcH (DUF465 family)